MGRFYLILRCSGCILRVWKWLPGSCVRSGKVRRYFRSAVQSNRTTAITSRQSSTTVMCSRNQDVSPAFWSKVPVLRSSGASWVVTATQGRPIRFTPTQGTEARSVYRWFRRLQVILLVCRVTAVRSV
jgi:hypothetical protein